VDGLLAGCLFRTLEPWTCRLRRAVPVNVRSIAT